MGLTHQNILGIRITTSSRALILEEIKKGLFRVTRNESRAGKKQEKSFVIVTPNPEQVVLAQHNFQFKEMLNKADVALPDGIGIVLASQFLQLLAGNSKQLTVQERISGVDFMQDLVTISTEQRVRIGLIGGLPGVAVKALECLRENHPRLEGWADEGPELIVGKNGDIEGPGEEYWIALVKRIASTNTHVLFVGLGAPKQEYVISRIARAMSLADYDGRGIILIAVGGSFDMIAGRLNRAPLFIRSIGFEWFWRLFQEPWRWRRQMALMEFVWLVVREKIQGR